MRQGRALSPLRPVDNVPGKLYPVALEMHTIAGVCGKPVDFFASSWQQ
jgi:hypothetical protein